MKFWEAMALVEQGVRVRRPGWGKPSARMHAVQQAGKGEPIVVVTGAGEAPFAPSQEDMLAEDWGARAVDLFERDEGRDPRAAW